MPVSKRYYVETTDRLSRVEGSRPYDTSQTYNPDSTSVEVPYLLKDRKEGGSNTVGAFCDKVFALKVASLLNWAENDG